MLVASVTADAFGTVCYVVAPGPGQRCLVVDPGVGVVSRLEDLFARHRLTPAGVLLTHGHLDHTFSVAALGDRHGVAVRVHADDRYRLGDPYTAMEPALTAMLLAQAGPWQPPRDVIELDGDDVTLELAGLRIGVAHAPGHTEGSVVFTLDDVPDALPADAGLSRTMFTGDVLFAGGIGRTDLPGGDDAAMTQTLRTVVLDRPDDTLVLPGHGPATTIGNERLHNPYLPRSSSRPDG